MLSCLLPKQFRLSIIRSLIQFPVQHGEGEGGAAIEAVLLLLLFTTSSAFAAAASAAIAALIQDSQGRGYDEMAPAIERRTARLAGVFPPLFCGTA